jgi:predicted 3-demethylubiquinone-9 3-methyltransferase (glyoxalase superfamily)
MLMRVPRLLCGSLARYLRLANSRAKLLCGAESQCGWCKDRWGWSWQITPRALIEAISARDRAAAKRAFDAMMGMKKIDIAAIEAAARGPDR